MRLVNLFLSFHGRIGRRGFWFGIIALMIAGSALAIPAYPNILSDNPFRSVLKNWSQMGPYGLLLSLVLLYPATTLVTKRLHDRGKTGWLAALVWAPAPAQTVAALIGWTPVLATFLSWTTWIIGYFVATDCGLSSSSAFMAARTAQTNMAPSPEQIRRMPARVFSFLIDSKTDPSSLILRASYRKTGFHFIRKHSNLRKTSPLTSPAFVP